MVDVDLQELFHDPYSSWDYHLGFEGCCVIFAIRFSRVTRLDWSIHSEERRQKKLSSSLALEWFVCIPGHFRLFSRMDGVCIGVAMYRISMWCVFYASGYMRIRIDFISSLFSEVPKEH